MATHTDIHRRPAGEVDTLRLVGATITIVYITPTQMKIMAQCDAHHAPFLSDPQWPERHVFQAYLRACATKAGRDMPGPKDIDTAYTVFQRQHPRPRPSDHETPNDGGTTQGEPTPSAEGWTPPTILLLAPNGHKHATRTVQRHHAPCAVRPLRFLTGCGAGVWVGGGRMGVRVGLWSACNGWLLVDGARWYGVWVGGLLVVVGRSY